MKTKRKGSAGGVATGTATEGDGARRRWHCLKVSVSPDDQPRHGDFGTIFRNLDLDGVLAWWDEHFAVPEPEDEPGDVVVWDGRIALAVIRERAGRRSVHRLDTPPDGDD